MMEKFESVTIFVLASNETEILRRTIDNIYNNCSYNDIKKVVVVLKSDSCPSFFEAKRMLSEDKYKKLETYIQKAPDLVLCIAELPELANSSHFVIMAGDMEMNPADIKTFIFKAKQYPSRIICAAKWHKDSQIEDYGFIHKLCSRMLNVFIGILYNKKVYDPFSIYQIYPKSVYNKLNFSNPELFLYEYTLKALKNNIEYEEIPTIYIKRKEGKSNFNLPVLIKTAVTFCMTAIRIRFSNGRNNENRE